MDGRESSSDRVGRLRNAAIAVGRRWRLHWIAILILLAIFLVIVGRGLPWAEAWSAVQRARPEWMIAALVANCGIFPFWASQWTTIAPVAAHPRWPRMLQITTLVALWQNILPAPGGHAAALGLLAVRGGLSPGAAISVVMMDQILTGAAKLTVLGAALALVPAPSWIRDGALSLSGLVVLLVVLLFVMAHRASTIGQYFARRPGQFARLAAKLCDGARHLEALRSGSRTGRGYLCAIAKITCDVLAALAVQYACGIVLSPASAVLVIAALNLSTFVRIPGNFGVYEATVLLIYQSLGVSPALALAAAVLQHFALLLPNLGIGLIVLATSRTR